MGWLTVSQGGRVIQTYGDVPHNHWSVCDSPASIDSLGVDEAEAREYVWLENRGINYQEQFELTLSRLMIEIADLAQLLNHEFVSMRKEAAEDIRLAANKLERIAKSFEENKL